jgi:hypothetical protein
MHVASSRSHAHKVPGGSCTGCEITDRRGMSPAVSARAVMVHATRPCTNANPTEVVAEAAHAYRACYRQPSLVSCGTRDRAARCA